jgi:hypothetical protein
MQPYLRSGWTCRLASDHAKVYCSWMHVVVSATPVYRNHHFACEMVTGSGELGLDLTGSSGGISGFRIL